MILVFEKKDKDGKIYYELTDTRTGLSRRWHPTKGYRRDKKALLDYLEAIARTMSDPELEQKQIERDVQDILNIIFREDEPPSVPEEMTLRQFSEHIFLPEKTVTISENTRDRWHGYLKKRIYPELGEMKLRDIKPYHLSGFLLSLQAEGLAYSTVNTYHMLLTRLFASAYLMEFIEHNPMDRVPHVKRRKDEYADPETPEAYTAAEIAHIMRCAEGEPLQWRAILFLMADTGMRRGECCALAWEDLDIKNNRIRIAHTLNYTKDKGVFISTPKNQKIRYIDIDPAIISLLLELRKQNNGHYIFCQSDGITPIHPHSVTKYFELFGKKYGVPRMHPHKLRHSFASIAITNGADVASVASLLGHSNSAFTLRQYTTANEESKLQANAIRRNAIKEASK